MVTNDKMSLMVPSTWAGPIVHLSALFTGLGWQGVLWLEGQSFILGRGRDRYPGGCREPRPGCANLALRVGRQPSAKVPSLITCQRPHSSSVLSEGSSFLRCGIMVMDDPAPAPLLTPGLAQLTVGTQLLWVLCSEGPAWAEIIFLLRSLVMDRIEPTTPCIHMSKS